VIRGSAAAKINLALVVGPKRVDGKHEVVTVLQRIDLTDRIELRPADALRVDGFADDTLVRRAVTAVAEAAGAAPAWRVRIEKRIPVAAGLGGGSADAALALQLANQSLGNPLANDRLHALARRLGSDVPFFLTDGPQLGTGEGSELEALDLAQDFWIVLVLPKGVGKTATADVYSRFDERSGADGFERRRDALLAAVAKVKRASDLAALPANDLASSSLAEDLRARGAFRADVSGAGPVVYGLFVRERDAADAASALGSTGRTWITAPAWYR
jgi:4-diphosphocytidyl-2-C-methyl-D-erythritol kinase